MSIQRAVAAELLRVAEALERSGDDPMRIRAYRRGATAIEGTEMDLHLAAASGTLTAIPNIGTSLAAKVVEYLSEGRMAVPHPYPAHGRR